MTGKRFGGAGGESRRLLRWGGRAALFAAGLVLLLELLFRTVLPSCEMPVSVQTPRGFLLYDASADRSGYTSYGRLPTTTYSWRINDQGWNSAFDYMAAEERGRPLIALIGDSSVEGLRCDVDEQVGSHLRELLGGEVEVYSFGRSGQPLSQHVLLMDRIDSLYRPDAYVLLAGQELVHKSFMPDWAVSFHYLVPQGDSMVMVSPAGRRRSALAETLLQSATVRYFVFNVGVRLFPLFEHLDAPHNWNAGMPPPEQDIMMQKVARYLLDKVAVRLDGREMLVVLDHWVTRYRIYDPDDPLVSGLGPPGDFGVLQALDGSYPAIEVVEMAGYFRERHEATGMRFESSDGKHLSGEGNRVVAEAVMEEMGRSGMLGRLTGAEADSTRTGR